MLKDELISRKIQAVSGRTVRLFIECERSSEQEIGLKVWKTIRKQFFEVPTKEFADLTEMFVMMKYAVTPDDEIVLILTTYGTVESEEEYYSKKLVGPIYIKMLGLDNIQLENIVARVKQDSIAEEVDEIWEESGKYCSFYYKLSWEVD